MARRGKVSEQESDWMPTGEESLLIRSAESLGRVIGSLQRELDNATRQLFSGDGSGRDGNGRSQGKSATAAKGKTVRRRTTKTAKAAAGAAKTAEARKAAKKPAARKATKRKK